MRVSREQAAENRKKIIAVAAKLFREKGFDGIGVAGLMKAAGLTHGGFYGHFDSKEDLMAQACDHAVDELLQAGELRSKESNDTPYVTFLKNYLSVGHRDHPGAGCLMAALGTEASRKNQTVRSAFTQSAKRLAAALMEIIPATNKKKARENALVTLAMLVGAQTIARALDDEEVSQEVLTLVLKKAKEIA
ncbi:TetR/AcrR family transcriptional regulator [Marinospirillum insulare]|uniref:TetR family transcriptional regulator n=1 Tax=Marinospirillum insulare TaxID=217169 RepID=A0ABQ5ZYZ6_9GAMM|nr:TetR/AcrR family transcriptional regulator [Marinospirillum insulare]GLR63228.1 TetR family transcriptional regulator [Marinospirillum insulare]